MINIIILKIDGKEFNSLHVLNFEIDANILDGDGTGRTKANGWPMVRQPQGQIKNLSIEVGLLENNSSNPDFLEFLSTLDSFGTREFAEVEFITPVGTIVQEMYSTNYKAKLTNAVEKRGLTFWGTISVNFIAKKGITV